jgi:hypothetical protein
MRFGWSKLSARMSGLLCRCLFVDPPQDKTNASQTRSMIGSRLAYPQRVHTTWIHRAVGSYTKQGNPQT